MFYMSYHFFSQIILSDLPSYECSDKITNEVSRKENLNTNKTIIYTAVNMAADILVILIIIFIVFYPDSFAKYIKRKQSIII